MTNEIIEAGRTLDALVAERVFERDVTPNVGGFDGRSGWHNDYGFTDSRHARNPPYAWGDNLPESNASYSRVPNYSTDIAAAWEVAEKMKDHPDAKKRVLRMVVYPYNRTYATFDAEADDGDWSEGNGDHHTEYAICLAALAAVGEEE